MSVQVHDLIVIGEGIAGLAAANHAARGGSKVATFESQLFGGLVLNVAELDGYPREGAVSGAELAAELMQSNSELGVSSIQEAVERIVPGDGALEVASAGGRHRARGIVIASGARLRKLGVPGEAEFEGRGVSQCADCDGPLYRDEEVVVVGGGDCALQEALVLAKFCRRVHVVHRGTRFRAAGRYADAVNAHPRITVLWNATVEAILGGKVVEKARVRRAGDGSVTELPCAGVFAYVGLEPSAAFAPEAIGRDERGFLVTNDGCETALPGVWAVGAVRSGYSGLLRDAVDEARRAAEAARRRLPRP